MFPQKRVIVLLNDLLIQAKTAEEARREALVAIAKELDNLLYSVQANGISLYDTNSDDEIQELSFDVDDYGRIAMTTRYH